MESAILSANGAALILGGPSAGNAIILLSSTNFFKLSSENSIRVTI